MRTLLVGLLLLTAACRRPSTQLAAMMTPVNQPSDFSQYLKAGDELIAMGNDPSWSLTINPSKGVLRFKTLAGDSLVTAVPERQTDSNGTFRYTAGEESEKINALFRPESCVDKLSGQRFDYRVEVTFRGKSYAGCGASLRQLALLNDIWVLSSFHGNPIAAGGPRNELPRLEISLSEGRVTGTTGCNRLSGTIKADTQTILFGPLITTRMACAGDVGQFESKFLQEFTDPLAYQVSEGKLTLLRAGKPIMVFRKVD
ncbi:META domain-containing protein [Spirosoma sp. HMF3257]|uniref:META domain-containing protein n=1 Tax=Spirosoma telluris TaxID=2183553 RepID=A0A327NS70_9BACT|nr:META domain-containing protein [Spirosoma telluris]RAI77299.1 META domain-containing protein [Spirosoma telluris]